MQQEPFVTAAAATPSSIVRDPEGDARWAAWQARAVANDRRSAIKLRVLMAVLSAGLITWLVVQLT